MTPGPPDDGSRPAGGGSGAGGPSLRDALDQLIDANLPREAFAVELAHLIARTSAIRSVVLTTCEMQRSRVSVLASVGLDPKALEILVSQAGRWLSLRCLNEHRINVISPAAENPFVPLALVRAINVKSLAIASIPFYSGRVPVGAAILFASTPAALSDSTLSNLSQALRHCGKLLAEPEAAAAPPATKLEPAGSPAAAPALPESGRVPTPRPAAAQPPRVEAGRAVARPAILARLDQIKAADSGGGEPARATAPPPPPPPPSTPAETPRRPAQDSDLAFLQRQLQEERRRVMLLENELAQSRAQAARLADQKGDTRKLNRQIRDTRDVADQARTHVVALRTAVETALNKAQPVAGLPAGKISVDGKALEVIARLTDSITALLSDTGALQHSASVPVAPPLLDQPPVARAAAPPPSDGSATPPTLTTTLDVLAYVQRGLHQSSELFGRDDQVLRELRDQLHMWRIRRSETDDAAADSAEVDAAQVTWLLGDQLDDLIDELERLRRRTATVRKTLDERLRDGPATAGAVKETGGDRSPPAR